MHNPMGKKLITYLNHHFCTQNHLNKSYKEACGGIDLSIHIQGCKKRPILHPQALLYLFYQLI